MSDKKEQVVDVLTKDYLSAMSKVALITDTGVCTGAIATNGYDQYLMNFTLVSPGESFSDDQKKSLLACFKAFEDAIEKIIRSNPSADILAFERREN